MRCQWRLRNRSRTVELHVERSPRGRVRNPHKSDSVPVGGGAFRRFPEFVLLGVHSKQITAPRRAALFRGRLHAAGRPSSVLVETIKKAPNSMHITEHNNSPTKAIWPALSAAEVIRNAFLHCLPRVLSSTFPSTNWRDRLVMIGGLASPAEWGGGELARGIEKPTARAQLYCENWWWRDHLVLDLTLQYLMRRLHVK